MTKLFPFFAMLALLAVAAALLVGLSLGDFQATAGALSGIRAKLSAGHLLAREQVGELEGQALALQGIEGRASAHRVLGLFAGILVLLASCVAITYFLGTSRWCREVAEAYGLPFHPVQRSLQLKRRTFALATICMLTAVVMVALGGASDPSTGRPTTAAWVQYHFLAALGGICLLVWCYSLIYGYIRENQEIIHGMMAAVKAERQKRQQPVE